MITTIILIQIIRHLSPKFKELFLNGQALKRYEVQQAHDIDDSLLEKEAAFAAMTSIIMEQSFRSDQKQNLLNKIGGCSKQIVHLSVKDVEATFQMMTESILRLS